MVICFAAPSETTGAGSCNFSRNPGRAVHYRSAEAFAGVAILGLLYGPAYTLNAMLLLGSLVLAITIIVGVIWQSRVRAARRRNAALEAYARREIAAQRVGAQLA